MPAASNASNDLFSSPMLVSPEGKSGRYDHDYNFFMMIAAYASEDVSEV